MTAQRPGGRSARIRTEVHDAVVELLQEAEWDALSIAQVAERSGVHQATIYRRWGTLTGLVDDVVSERLIRSSPVPDTGTLRGDLDAYATQAALDVAGPLGAVFLRGALVGSRSAEDQIYLMQRGVNLQAMLDRAGARGENPPTLLELMEVVLAPIYFHAIFFGVPMEVEQAKTLVDRLQSLHAQPGA